MYVCDVLSHWVRVRDVGCLCGVCCLTGVYVCLCMQCAISERGLSWGPRGVQRHRGKRPGEKQPWGEV